MPPSSRRPPAKRFRSRPSGARITTPTTRGGIPEVLAAHPKLAVVGHASDRGRIPGQTVFASEGDILDLASEIRARVIHNPGHTRGAISFFVEDGPLVFTGDTLFGGGCGRLFEGTPEEMLASLDKLRALPGPTKVYFGHEYTKKNLDFAAAVEPENSAIVARAAEVADGNVSVPSTIASERATNPFFRAEEPAVARAAARAGEGTPARPVEVFAAIRRWKDTF